MAPRPKNHMINPPTNTPKGSISKVTWSFYASLCASASRVGQVLGLLSVPGSNAAGPGTKSAAGATAGSPRSGDGGGGGAALIRAARSRGEEAATAELVLALLPGLGNAAGPGEVASSVVRETVGGGAATSAEVELILNCRVRRPEDVVEKK